MIRHPKLAIRKAEHISKNRVDAFTKSKVNEFYDLYEKVFNKYNILPVNIYSIDETPILTVPKSAPKIIVPRGQKQIGGIVSGERSITVEICFSVNGNYMPPLLIFLRKNRNQKICESAPPGSTVEFHPSGYIDTDIFHR